MPKKAIIENSSLQVYLISSVEKVFPDDDPGKFHRITGLSALRGERIQFQVICHDPGSYLNWIGIRIGGKLASCAKVRQLQWMPCLCPVTADSDDPAVITKKAGLFPGPLIETEKALLIRHKLTVFHVSLSLPENLKCGKYGIKIEVHYSDLNGEKIGTLPLNLDVINAVLPPQKMLCEMWLHADCLMHHYQLDMRSRKFKAILENCFRNMAEHGINTLLTPLWTPPLDTKPGGERITNQLLDITYERGVYSFDFRR